MFRLIRLLIAAVAAVYLIVFAVQNRTPVEVVLWPGAASFTLPLWGVAMIALVTGVVLAGLAIWFGGMAWRSRAAAAERRLKAQEQRRENLERREEEAAAQRAAERRKAAENEGRAQPSGRALAAPAPGTKPLALSSS